MQYSPQQIKDRLLRALDEDNNVVDMAQVLEVISILETYAITREALEQTRIGKTVNDMRKKTKNEGLAKRAKRLVRKWQTLVQASAGGDTAATTNGDPTASLQHPNVAMLQGSPRSRPSSPASVHSNISPGLPHSRPGTPLTPGGRVGVNRAQTRPHTPNSVHSNRTNLSPKPGGRPAIPASQKAPSERKLGEITHSLTGPNKGCLVSPSTSGRLASPAVSGRLISPAKSGRVISPASAVSGGLVSSVKSGSARQSPSLDGGQIKKPEKPRVNHSNGNNSMSPALCEDRSDVRKRGRNEVDSDRTTAKRLSVRTPVDNPSLAKQKSAVNGRVKSDTKPSSLKGFVREGDSTLGQTAVQTPASSTPSHGNARDKESLSAKRNINFTMQPKSADVDLPGKDRLVKPPKARVKTTAQIIADLQAKSDTVDKDMVRRIASVEREADDLHQSIVPPGALPRARRKPHESTPLIGGRGRGKLSPNKTELVEKFLQSSVATPSPVEDYTSFRDGDSPPPSASSPCSPVEPVAGPSNSQTQPSEKLVDPLSLLPPLDLEEIVWDEEEGYEVREREITDADLERISDERWVGVNGCYNSAGQWRDWTQTFSSQTFGDEMLHILPYVNIDD